VPAREVADDDIGVLDEALTVWELTHPAGSAREDHTTAVWEECDLRLVRALGLDARRRRISDPSGDQSGWSSTVPTSGKVICRAWVPSGRIVKIAPVELSASRNYSHGPQVLALQRWLGKVTGQDWAGRANACEQQMGRTSAESQARRTARWADLIDMAASLQLELVILPPWR
jgi:hypothetical protein